MGTNYYVRPKDACPVRCDRWVHLGKSSAGWDFSFRAYPDRPAWDAHDIITWPVVDYASWLRLLDLGDIYDEYGNPERPKDLLRVIDVHRGGKSTLYRDDFHDGAGHRFTPGEFS
jgi:hypothetical protein